MRAHWIKTLLGLGIVAALMGAYWLLSGSTVLTEFFKSGTIQVWITALGAWGPLAVVGLMAAAVVLSPIPSAPIALAAGAVYGHLWGTWYVLVGAELGALIAFGLARLLGYIHIRAWFGDRLDVGILGSQNVLMVTIFLSRLMPFISFDIVSYSAGLTSLALWRFAIATLAGIIPASFLFAHFGRELTSADTDRVMMAVLVFGAITGLPILIKALGFKLRTPKIQLPAAGERARDHVSKTRR